MFAAVDLYKLEAESEPWKVSFEDCLSDFQSQEDSREMSRTKARSMSELC